MSTGTTTPGSIPPTWAGLLDDAAIFPPASTGLDEAVHAHRARQGEWYDDLVATFVVTDEKLPRVRAPLSVSVVVTTGAGGIAGAARLGSRAAARLAGLEIALRDPDDLAGNARRVVAAVDAARADGLLDDEVTVSVELPQGPTTAGWLDAADVVAAAEHQLKFRTGGVEAHLFPTAPELASWVDAALDRETPFKCTAGLHNAVRHTAPDTGFEHHGFVNVLLATRRAFDGASLAEVVDVLEDRDATHVATAAAEADLAGARRWFTSLGTCSVGEPLDDLLALGLLEAPR